MNIQVDNMVVCRTMYPLNLYGQVGRVVMIDGDLRALVRLREKEMWIPLADLELWKPEEPDLD